MRIRNPILPGFNPDPSICRVGDDYYIATSTFEWFPGVQIHHSRDLVNWRLLTRPLDRVSLLDMRGVDNSGGIWAPALTYADGRFWLVYTVVRSLNGAVKDTPNYVTTAEKIEGPWSEPIYLNSSGFDPSLFHDVDGRKWLVNMLWDHRPGRGQFAGIVLQEFDATAGRLIGPIKNIFRGSEIGVTEGPHFIRRGETYYLVLAEGGTSYGHAVTLARSREITGPYELDPEFPTLTSRDDPTAPLQKAGHASFVETPDGWYVAHLVGRPLTERGRCPLGRETALQRVDWPENGWPRLAHGGRVPAVEVQAPQLAPHPWPAPFVRRDFNADALPPEFQTLRIPFDGALGSLTKRPGFLRLTGRESLESHFEVALVARRAEHFEFEARTRVEAAPTTFQQMAGIVAYYSSIQWFALWVTWSEEAGRCLRIASVDDGRYREEETTVALPDGPVELAAAVSRAELQFRWRNDGEWQDIGPKLGFDKLSDDYSIAKGWRFTGAFVGMAAVDLSGQRLPADFAWFDYEPADGSARKA